MVPHSWGHQLFPFHRWKHQVLHHVLWRTCKSWGWADKTHPKLLVITHFIKHSKSDHAINLWGSGVQANGCRSMLPPVQGCFFTKWLVSYLSHLSQTVICLVLLTPVLLLCVISVFQEWIRVPRLCLVAPRKCPPDPGIVLSLRLKHEIHTLLNK